MPQSPSPYALLCACKPKPAPTLVTAYDLYSASQTHAEQESFSGRSSAISPSGAAPSRSDQSHPTPSLIQSKRTHYISDIKSRHNLAVRRAGLP